MKLARTAPPLAWDEPEMPAPADTVRLAVARDEAFCFYYEDSLDTLRSCGAELIFFSPLHDGSLPDCDGLYQSGIRTAAHQNLVEREHAHIHPAGHPAGHALSG